MKKSIFITFLLIFVLVVYEIKKPKSENQPVASTTSVQNFPLMSSSSSKITAAIEKSSQIHNMDNSEEKSINDIVDLVTKVIPANNPVNKSSTQAIDDYLVHTFAAINSTNKADIIKNYNNAYMAMSCSVFFMQEANLNAFSMFSNINKIMSQNKKISAKRLAAEEQISGTIFSDITTNEKKVVCNEKYNQQNQTY